MSSRILRKALITLAGGGLLFSAANVMADWGLNLPRGVTPISQQAYDLHMLILWICVVIGIVVFGAMFISMISHRKSKGAVAAQFHESTAVEIVWTIIPFLILIGMAIPATRALIDMENTSDADLSIKVTAYQWKWGYEYLDEDIRFYSTLSTPKEEIFNKEAKGKDYLLEVDNPVVVPANKKVRLLITAADVIHAWWVPEFGMKKDAIPGFVNEMWFKVDTPGTYRGQCAELCGKDHGFMPIVVIAKTEDEYSQWVTDQKAGSELAAADALRAWSQEELVANGEQVYAANCAACHQVNGEGIPGTFPAIKGSPVATGAVDAHIDIVMNGKAGTAMQAFAAQLDDTDIAAVVTYQRNALGNAAGDTVQPADIKVLR